MGGIDCIDLAVDRDRLRELLKALVNSQFPHKCCKFLSSLGRVSFPEWTLLHGVSYLLEKCMNFIMQRNL